MKSRSVYEAQREIERIRRERRTLGKILFYGAGIVGMLAFFYMLGVVGHSDYCVEAHIEDDWSTMKYIVHCFISLLVMYLSIKVADIGEYWKDC